MTDADHGRLARTLNLGQVVASGVGIIVGAGIYVLLGAATETAGAGVWLSFLAAGALSALTALSYAELVSMYPHAGAEYEYTRRVASPGVAFIIGWMMIIGLVIAAAAVSLGFASYVRSFVDVPSRVGALGLLGAVAVIARSGVRRSATIATLLAVVQVGGLVLVIAIGLPHLGEHSLIGSSSPGSVMQGAALVFFAFIGFDEVITLAEETRDPVRTVPRALLIALALSTVLYVAVAVAAVSVLGADRLAGASRPLADVMAAGLGSWSARVVALIAMVATANTTLLAVTAASRLTYGMADTGALARAFARLNAARVPSRAIVSICAIAGAAAAIGNLRFVASVTDVAIYVVFIAVNGTVIALRYRQPDRRRPFRVPWALGRVPIPTCLALATIFVFVPSLELPAVASSAALALCGAGLYFGLARRKRASAPSFPAQSDPNSELAMTIRHDVTRSEAERAASELRIDFRAVEFDFDEFLLGLTNEVPHGRSDPDTNVTDDDLLTIAKIALAHLNEIPDYYTRLTAMERAARKVWRTR